MATYVVTGNQNTCGPGTYLVRTPGVTITLETWTAWPNINQSIIIEDQTGSSSPNITIAPPLYGLINLGAGNISLNSPSQSVTCSPTVNGNQWAATAPTASPSPTMNTVALIGDSITAASQTQVSQTFTASGGTAPYTMTFGNLPSAITATFTTPSVVFAPNNCETGSATFTVTVTDSASQTAVFTFGVAYFTSQKIVFTLLASTGALSLTMTGQVYAMNDRGAAYWINFLSNGALSVPYNFVFGHVGDTTAGVLSRMAEIIAVAPKVGAYALMIGTNDLGILTLAQLEANILSIVTQLLATGKPVYLETILPRSLSPTTNAVAIKQLYGVNRWIKSLAGTVPNLRIVDNQAAYGDPFDANGAPRSPTGQAFFTSGGTGPYTWTATGLPANVTMTANATTTWGVLASTATVASTQTITITVTDSASHTGTAQAVLTINPQLPNPISVALNGTVSGTLPITKNWDFSYDGLHPKSAGAFAAFSPLVAALMQGVAAAGMPTVSNLDAYDATNNPHGNLLPNPMLSFGAGTGVTTSGTNNTVSGKVADGWQVYTPDNGITGTVATVASADVDSLGNPAQKLVISGTANGGYETLVILAINITNFANFNYAAALTASCRVEVAGGATGVSAPFIYMVSTSGPVTNTVAAGAWFNSSVWDGDVAPNTAFAGVISTPNPPLAGAGGFSGTLSLQIGFVIVGNRTQTMAMTAKISCVSLTQ